MRTAQTAYSIPLGYDIGRTSDFPAQALDFHKTHGRATENQKQLRVGTFMVDDVLKHGGNGRLCFCKIRIKALNALTGVYGVIQEAYAAFSGRSVSFVRKHLCEQCSSHVIHF